MQGSGGYGVVASAFGDTRVADVFDGRDDGSADGGQAGGPAAGAVGCVRAGGGLQGAGRRGLRPGPASRVELSTGISRQRRALIPACGSGWFFLTTAM
jgi:hypothetical protein